MKKVYKIFIPPKRISSITKKLNVAAYVRVSTKEEVQVQSFKMQIEWYTKMIQNNPEWNFAGVYADYGMSGLRKWNRTEFNLMIEQAKQGKIDMIVTKSIGRFSRNTIDTLAVIRELKEINVDVWFEIYNMHTLDQKGEVNMSLLSALAQEESRNMSENIHWGFESRFMRGETFTKYKNFYGFT